MTKEIKIGDVYYAHVADFHGVLSLGRIYVVGETSRSWLIQAHPHIGSFVRDRKIPKSQGLPANWGVTEEDVLTWEQALARNTAITNRMRAWNFKPNTEQKLKIAEIMGWSLESIDAEIAEKAAQLEEQRLKRGGF